MEQLFLRLIDETEVKSIYTMKTLSNTCENFLAGSGVAWLNREIIFDCFFFLRKAVFALTATK